MNRYLLCCLLALLSLFLTPSTAQRGLPAKLSFPASQAARPAPAFPTTFFLPTIAVAAASSSPTPAPVAPLPVAPLQEASLARQALRELRLSWQFIKQQFRYEQ